MWLDSSLRFKPHVEQLAQKLKIKQKTVSLLRTRK